jgi:hypothetical protein
VSCFIGFLLPVLHGGDHFGGFRFYQLIYPLLILNIFMLWRGQFQDRLEIRSLPLAHKIWVITVLLLCSFLFHKVTWNNIGTASELKHEFSLAEGGRNQGRRMAELFAGSANYPSVGVVWAGGIKVTYPGIVIDLMGLNNLKMGHSPGERKGPKNHAAFNQDIFFELKPDIVLESSYLGKLFANETFTEQYEYGEIKKKRSNRWFKGFFAKEFLETIRQSEQFVVQ